MSYYRKRRKVGLSSGAGKVVTWILVGFLVISVIPLLFSLGNLGGLLPTEPSAPATDPMDPTEPEPTDPPPIIETGYLLYQLDAEGNRQYLTIEDDAEGASLVSDPDEACLYEWNADYNTLFVLEDSVDRFLGVPAGSSLTNFKTYARNSKYIFAQFMAIGFFLEGDACPLVANTPYYLAVQGADTVYYYSGAVSGGCFTATDSVNYVCQVFVEYVTRERPATVHFLGFDVTNKQDGDWTTWEKWFG